MIVLIRHARTVMAGRFCGHIDPPLSAQGVAQLEELKARLTKYPFTHIYSSDLQRALQTAESVAGDYQLPVRVLPSLREIGFGDWEGLNWDEITARDPAYAQHWLSCFPTVAAPNGEDFSALVHRIEAALNLIADEAQDGCAAVVTHAGVICTFLKNVALSTGAPDLSVCKNCSCWELYRDADQRWVAGAEPHTSPRTEARH